MRIGISLPVCVIALLVSASCTSIDSNVINPGSNSCGQTGVVSASSVALLPESFSTCQTGLVYHLPLKSVGLIVTVSKATASNDAKPATSASAPGVAAPAIPAPAPASSATTTTTTATTTTTTTTTVTSPKTVAPAPKPGQDPGGGSPTSLVRTPGVVVSDAYPDTRTNFVLTVGQSQFSRTDFNIGVSDKGLLNSSTTVTSTGETPAILVGLVQSSGAYKLGSGGDGRKGGECTVAGTYVSYVNLLNLKSTQVPVTICGFTFTLHFLGKPDEPLSGDSFKNVPRVPSRAGGYRGLYYRQTVGILVTVDPPDKTVADSTQFIAFVPDPRQANALPIRPGVFTTNKANFTFVDGIPTQYGGTQDSELLGIVGLPATLATSYFTAIGQIFSAIGGSKSAQASALTQNQALQLEQYKTSLCLKALSGHDDAGIAANCPH